MSLLEVRNLSKFCSDSFGIDGVSFTVEEKGVYGFFGKSGSGKSVIAAILSGMSDADSGEVLYKGYDMLASEKQAATIKRKIGMVCDPEWFDEDMTLRETLDFTGRVKGVDPDKRARQIKEALTLLGIESKADVLVQNLTRGDKKRMAYANALIGNPDTVIIDEPFSAAEMSIAEDVKRLISMLGKMKVVLVFSKKPDMVEELCNYIGIISGGKLLDFDTVENMHARLNRTSLGLLRIRENRAARDQILTALRSVDDVCSVKFSSNSGTIADYVVESTQKGGVSDAIKEKLDELGVETVSFKFTSCGIANVLDALSEDGREEV